jgi:predicted HTH domain antitoxin
MVAASLDDLLPLFGDNPEDAERTVCERLDLDLLRRGEISAGRAAELLGIDRLAMMRLQSADGIPVFDLSREELSEDIGRLRSS